MFSSCKGSPIITTWLPALPHQAQQIGYRRFPVRARPQSLAPSRRQRRFLRHAPIFHRRLCCACPPCRQRANFALHSFYLGPFLGACIANKADSTSVVSTKQAPVAAVVATLPSDPKLLPVSPSSDVRAIEASHAAAAVAARAATRCARPFPHSPLIPP